MKGFTTLVCAFPCNLAGIYRNQVVMTWLAMSTPADTAAPGKPSSYLRRGRARSRQSLTFHETPANQSPTNHHPFIIFLPSTGSISSFPRADVSEELKRLGMTRPLGPSFRTRNGHTNQPNRRSSSFIQEYPRRLTPITTTPLVSSSLRALRL